MNTPLQNAIEISAALRETRDMYRRLLAVTRSYLHTPDKETLDAGRAMQVEREAGTGKC